MSAELEAMIREQARTMAAQCQAIADGRIRPEHLRSASMRVSDNASTLVAWAKNFDAGLTS